MTRITVINPNTTRAMTESIGACARAVSGAAITAVNPDMGPVSIESHYDEALAVPGILDLIARSEAAGAADAYVIACFGDPGLDAARERAAGPVVGIAEAAMHLATLVGRSFSIVTTLSRTTGSAWDLVSRYGFRDRCRAVVSCDVPVLALEDPASNARRIVTELCRTAVEEGADSVVLGCAGMADFCVEIGRQIGVPVIDGVAAAVRLAETLVELGLATSTRDEYAPPPAKPYVGLLQQFGARPVAQPRLAG